MVLRKVNMSENVVRKLNQFPKSYKFSLSSYPQLDFCEITRNYCTGLSGGGLLHLKVCKMIILGDLCVGKTSLLNRFCHKLFTTDYKTTIGVDFQTEEINILGIPYHLQLWDTAGQERFKCIAQCYYRKAHVIILVFDLSSIRTLANCKNWLRDALEASNESDSPFIFLVGAKKDLLSSEACKNVEELANLTAKKLNAEFWTVSAKTGENIDELFHRAATLAFDEDVKIANEKDNTQNSIEIGTELISFRRNHAKKQLNKCGEGIKCNIGLNRINNK